MVAPAPGTMPTTMPSIEERANVPFTCPISAAGRQLGLDLAELLQRRRGEALLEPRQHLAQPVGAHHDAQILDAVPQRVEAEREALRAVGAVDADGGDQQPDEQRHEGIDLRSAAQADDAGEAEQDQREIFRRRERQRQPCHRLRQRPPSRRRRPGRRPAPQTGSSPAPWPARRSWPSRSRPTAAARRWARPECGTGWR